MNLENVVRQEVNSWKVNIFRHHQEQIPVNYNDLVKPILYGISIGVSEKITEELKTHAESNLRFLNLGYHDAIREFKREYLLRNLQKHNYSCIETAKAILKDSITDESARTNLAQILIREFGCSVTELKKNAEKNQPKELFNFEDEALNQKLVNLAETEIKRYAKLIDPRTLLRKLLENNCYKIAERLVEVSKDTFQKTCPTELGQLFGLQYEEAMDKFKKWYLTEQTRKYVTGIKTAEKIGLTLNGYRTLICSHGIKVREIPESNKHPTN